MEGREVAVNMFVDDWLDKHLSPMGEVDKESYEWKHFRGLFVNIISDYQEHILKMIDEEEKEE